MGDNLDKVFVDLPYLPFYGMYLLKWTLDRFDKDKTMIILTNIRSRTNVKAFLDEFRSKYLPRCTERKFRAEILIPDAAGKIEASIKELITEHGMNKLVTTYNYISAASKVFEKAPNLSCKIWYLDTYDYDANLLFTKTYGPDDAETLTKTIMDVENSMKKADKVNISSKQVEKELVSQSDHLKLQDEQALRSNFTIEDLKHATHNFSNILGKGTYGSVYKGYLGGMDVAVKILNPECSEGVLGFKQEVAILTTCRHPYLVTLIGVCYESSALVYEFLPNGSLEDHLTGKKNTSPLTWQVRTRIMCEICVALNFLHSNKPKMVIHGDLKPDNILLDANFRSKLGDFGISRIVERSNANTTLYYSTLHPVGTFTYMDPQFTMTGKLTEKSDVFAFGVIVLRLLTGKSTPGFVSGVEEAIENGTLDKMIDASAGEWPFDQAKELAQLALRCVEFKRTDRPNLFSEVWPILERLQRNIKIYHNV